MSNALFLLLVLACPLLMVFVMRGMHGGHGRGGQDAPQGGDRPHGRGGHGAQEAEPLDELRRRREALDREIAAREGAESEAVEEERAPPQPVA